MGVIAQVPDGTAEDKTDMIKETVLERGSTAI